MWGINNGQAYRYNPATRLLVLVPGKYSAISVGADGSAWAVDGGGQVYRYNAGTRLLQFVSGNLTGIATGGGNNVWGVDGQSRVFRLQGSNFVQVPGTMGQVDAGGSATGSGAAWGVGP